MEPLFGAMLGFPVLLVIGLKLFLSRAVRCLSPNRLEGKTVLVTGASSGIGRAIATECAARGARVVLACRNNAKAEATVAYIRRKAGNPEVFYIQLDLACLESVRGFAEYYSKQFGSLDVLVNNAAYMGPLETTKDGYEMTFQVNYLSHFLLSNLLIQRLSPSREHPLRVVNLASDSYRQGRLDFDDLFYKNSPYDIYAAYGGSKLALMMFSTELNYRFADWGVTSVSVHPGAVKSGLLRNWPGKMGGVLRAAAKILFRSPESGAESVIFCAVVDELDEFAGKCVHDCEVMSVDQQARDFRRAERLWNVSAALTDLDKTLHNDDGVPPALAANET